MPSNACAVNGGWRCCFLRSSPSPLCAPTDSARFRSGMRPGLPPWKRWNEPARRQIARGSAGRVRGCGAVGCVSFHPRLAYPPDLAACAGYPPAGIHGLCALPPAGDSFRIVVARRSAAPAFPAAGAACPDAGRHGHSSWAGRSAFGRNRARPRHCGGTGLIGRAARPVFGRLFPDAAQHVRFFATAFRLLAGNRPDGPLRAHGGGMCAAAVYGICRCVVTFSAQRQRHGISAAEPAGVCRATAAGTGHTRLVVAGRHPFLAAAGPRCVSRRHAGRADRRLAARAHPRQIVAPMAGYAPHHCRKHHHASGDPGPFRGTVSPRVAFVLGVSGGNRGGSCAVGTPAAAAARELGAGIRTACPARSDQYRRGAPRRSLQPPKL